MSSRRKKKPSAPERDFGPVERKARISALVRMARRAGRIVIGVRLSREAARRGEVAAVLVADDLSASRRDRLVSRWRDSGIRVLEGWSKDELGEIAGKPAVAVLGITDRNFAAGIAALDARSKVSMEEKAEREE